MAFDVFISYSQKDAAAANGVCRALESHGIPCWIAPRDVPAGQGWKGSIVEAIRHARVVVLIFSAEVNASKQVRREVDIAFESGRPILPLRIENVEMGDDLYYCLADRHWLDAITPPLEQHIDQLVHAIRGLLGEPGSPPLPAVAAAIIGTGAAADAAAVTAATIAPALSPSLPAAPEPAPIAAHTARTATRRSSAKLWIGVVAVIAVVAVVWVAWIMTRGDDPHELFARGYAYEFGDGVGINLDLAHDYYAKAAALSDADAQVALGRMALSERPPQGDEAAKWYEAAAKQGHPEGACGLGTVYAEIRKEYPAAHQWYQAAADKQAGCGEYGLGRLYWYGYGVAEDRATSIRWMQQAAAHGDPQARAFMAQFGR
jgi:hypothetical protein